MNAEKIAVLTCFLTLTGAAARAQGLNWNADPAAQLKAAMAADKIAIAVPRGAEVRSTKEAAHAAAVRLEARPLGTDRLSHDSDSFNDDVQLTLNNGKDRVGATFSNCVRGGGDDIPVCDQIDFVFTQLSVDRQAKTIKLGDETVATLGGFWKGTRLAKGWRLVVSRTQEVVDGGFNRYTITRVSVTLEK